MNTTYKAALEILLFGMEIDNTGSCTMLLKQSLEQFH